jgi:hypothetical protein
MNVKITKDSPVDIYALSSWRQSHADARGRKLIDLIRSFSLYLFTASKRGQSVDATSIEGQSRACSYEKVGSPAPFPTAKSWDSGLCGPRSSGSVEEPLSGFCTCKLLATETSFRLACHLSAAFPLTSCEYKARIPA